MERRLDKITNHVPCLNHTSGTPLQIIQTNWIDKNKMGNLVGLNLTFTCQHKTTNVVS